MNVTGGKGQKNPHLVWNITGIEFYVLSSPFNEDHLSVALAQDIQSIYFSRPQ